MTIVIQDTYKAQCDKDDNGNKTWTLNFTLQDDNEAGIDPEDAYAAAYAYAVANKDFDDLTAKSIQLEEEEEGAGRVYRLSIKYTINGDLGSEEESGQTVYGTLRFSTKGGSSHINHSLSTTGTYRPRNGDAPPNFSGLINVQNGTPAGVDIQTPVLHIDVTCKLPTALITPQWLATFYSLTGKVNSNALWSYPAHTLLFRGLDGSTDGSGTCNLTFSFDFQPNTSDEVDPFDVITKNGWEYVWVYSELKTDATSNTTVPKPIGLYVEQVYPEESFAPFNFIQIR